MRLRDGTLRRHAKRTKVSQRGLNSGARFTAFGGGRLAVGDTAQRGATWLRGSLNFRGPETVGQVAFEQTGEGLGEVGELVTFGLACADTYGAGTDTQWSEEAS